MTRSPKIRGWKAFALLAAFIAVLLLTLPHAADHHAALFLLVPILLFLEPVKASIPYQPRKHHVVAPNHHVRSTLFQRPPPAQA